MARLFDHGALEGYIGVLSNVVIKGKSVNDYGKRIPLRAVNRHRQRNRHPALLHSGVLFMKDLLSQPDP